MVRYFKNQNYVKLRKSLQAEGALFTDPEFPATDASLYVPGSKPSRAVQWKRPKDIASNPKLVIDGVDGNDLNQGDVGNCWFVAACSTLAGVPELWNKVVVKYKDQEWDDEHPEKYVGIFRFHFWRMGEWVEVVVDDQLPTVNGRLVYVHSKDANEFWSPLLEKAYAKLAGSYEGLDAGNTGDALVDFSGGVCEPLKLSDYDTEEKEKQLFRKMVKAMSRQAMISCSIRASETEREARLDTGLVKGHAYGVTAVKKVKVGEGIFFNKKFKLIRMRNPWGEKEWNGAWSDGSEEWANVSADERERLGLTFDDDGEFWMLFSDWLKHYTDASIARLLNTSLITLRKTWCEGRHFGNWKGATAGGCINNKDTFFRNPQFVFNVSKGEDGVAMIELSQEDRRSMGEQNLSIGYQIFKVEENRVHRVKQTMESAGSVTFINTRSVFSSFTLQEGRYVVIPSTFKPGQEGRFMLRLFTEEEPSNKELVKETLTVPKWRCCTSNYTAVVKLHILSAAGLAKQDLIGDAADPYVYVRIEGQTARTPCQQGTLNPKFDSRLIFFVRRPTQSPVSIEVWNDNLIKDSFMGQVLLKLTVDGGTRQTTLNLHEEGSPSKLTKGSITLTYCCTDDLMHN